MHVHVCVHVCVGVYAQMGVRCMGRGVWLGHRHGNMWGWAFIQRMCIRAHVCVCVHTPMCYKEMPGGRMTLVG